tara:strand:- start:1875 stop:2279 length:405 start_codon:yes stop_codon:yes gene_type:complete
MRKTIEFVKKVHGDQVRKETNRPYWNHPVTVSRMLKSITTDKNIIIAGLLHDVLEDTSFNEKEMREMFGEKITSIVKEVSKNKEGKFEIKTKEGLIVKLVDILHNLSDQPKEKYIKKSIGFLNSQNEFIKGVAQ